MHDQKRIERRHWVFCGRTRTACAMSLPPPCPATAATLESRPTTPCGRSSRDRRRRHARLDRPPGRLHARHRRRSRVPADHPRFLRRPSCRPRPTSPSRPATASCGDRGPGRRPRPRRGRRSSGSASSWSLRGTTASPGSTWPTSALTTSSTASTTARSTSFGRCAARLAKQRLSLRPGHPHLALSGRHRRPRGRHAALQGTEPGPDRLLRGHPLRRRAIAGRTGRGPSIRPARASAPTGRDVVMSCIALATDRDRRAARAAGEPAADGRLRLRRALQPAEPQVRPGDGHRRGDYATIFVSGTASITDSETRHLDDVEGQTHQTLDNIAALISAKQLLPPRPAGLRGHAGRPGPGAGLHQAAGGLRQGPRASASAAGRTAHDLCRGRRLPAGTAGGDRRHRLLAAAEVESSQRRQPGEPRASARRARASARRAPGVSPASPGRQPGEPRASARGWWLVQAALSPRADARARHHEYARQPGRRHCKDTIAIPTGGQAMSSYAYLLFALCCARFRRRARTAFPSGSISTCTGPLASLAARHSASLHGPGRPIVVRAETLRAGDDTWFDQVRGDLTGRLRIWKGGRFVQDIVVPRAGRGASFVPTVRDRCT